MQFLIFMNFLFFHRVGTVTAVARWLRAAGGASGRSVWEAELVDGFIFEVFVLLLRVRELM
jgi:hypothetical protein